MKLLLAHFSAGRIGGVETVIDEHAALFSKHGHEVTIVSGSRARQTLLRNLLNCRSSRQSIR